MCVHNWQRNLQYPGEELVKYTMTNCCMCHTVIYISCRLPIQFCVIAVETPACKLKLQVSKV